MSLFNLPVDNNWKDIPGYEGTYQVSRSGQVKRLGGLVKTKRGHTQFYPEKILTPYLGQVYLSKGGSVTTVRLEDIVAEVFVPNVENKSFLHHVDLDFSNCSADNLVWVNNDDIAEPETDDWRYVPGMYPYYMVSCQGDVKSCNHYSINHNRYKVYYTYHPGCRLTYQINHDGYRVVMISLEGKSKLVPIHRMVALAFISNLDNKPQVNHIDGDKLNDDVTNLEWVTRSENMIHARDTGLWDPQVCGAASRIKTGKPVRCISDGREFASISECSKFYSVDSSSVTDAIRNSRSCKGHKFEYLES